MTRRLVLLTTLVFVLPGMLSVALEVHTVQASGTIYIRADGHVIPSKAPISSTNNVTYYFTGNIYDEIVVERSNIIIDGNEYTLQGNRSGNGLCLYNTSNVTIRNTNIRLFYRGVYLNSTSHNVLYGNNMKDNDFAIWLNHSSNSTISGNNMNNNDNGIWFAQSSDNMISENNITGNMLALGIGFVHSVNNTICGNNIKNNYEGIYLDRSSNNNISRNNITANNPLGIWHHRSSNNMISENNIEDNYKGLYLWHSSSNTISGNNIATNNLYGVYLGESSNNNFYHNNFIDNAWQVYIYILTSDYNSWDDGVEGNYWSNYTGIDFNHDGVGESPHVLDANNQDNYPLISSIRFFDAGTWNGVSYRIDIASNSTVSGFCFNPNEGPFLRFNLTGENETSGICRVTVPKNLLWAEDGWAVLVDNEPIIPLITPHENFTYLYFTYNHSAKMVEIQGTDVIPEFSSSIIVPLFMAATLMAVMIYRKKHSMHNYF